MSRRQAEPIALEDIQAMARYALSRGHSHSKWAVYCGAMLRLGLSVSVYKALTTKSKYIYVSNGRKEYKVRFSDHRPNRQRSDDCDFIVGRSHLGSSSTRAAIEATKEYFGINNETAN
ncbi:hypothetical protein D0962_22810 [Leptolyngbyaceae cyanobacterium CCMR0082]|uniref:Uncharacterized protein n=1 Tax=Adonisia turfae CCMR0082 TaxID=2304604 RepID=A0A6M0SD03_9CYAN|nr:hypothetical protein [Adonisia turfae CCMR0082]